MDVEQRGTQTALYRLFFLISFSLIIAAFFTGPVTSLFPGFFRILTSTSALTIDACALGGLNGALLNTGLLGLISCLLLKCSGVLPAGPTMTAFFVTFGYGLFGKNCLNIWPVVAGVWCYAKIKKEPFAKHVPCALSGSALAPIVSEMLFNRHLDMHPALAIPLALLLGALFGFLVPPVAAYLNAVQKGHNLFAVGLTVGFLGFAFFTCYKTLILRPLGLEEQFALNALLSGGYPVFFPAFFGGIFALCIVCGFIANGRSFAGYGRLLKRTGYGCDFTALDGIGCTLINFGLLGLFAIGYFLLVKAPFTGATVGSVLGLVSLAGSGSHPRNVLPIFIGYWLVSLFAAWTLSTQAICVGVCFATGLSSLSGRWGPFWGAFAGALHACLVSYAVSLHGGFSVYNGGFTAGIVVLLLVPMLEALFSNVPSDKKEEALTKPMEKGPLGYAE